MVEDLFESAIRQDINKVLKENGWNSFSDKNLLNMTKKTLIEIIRMLENNWCCSIERHKNTIAYAEEIKANADYSIEGRDLEINELKAQNEELGQTVNRKIKDIQRLLAQIEKMKCCGNCSHRHYWGNELGCNLDLDKQFECDNNNKKYWEFMKE